MNYFTDMMTVAVLASKLNSQNDTTKRVKTGETEVETVKKTESKNARKKRLRKEQEKQQKQEQKALQTQTTDKKEKK